MISEEMLRAAAAKSNEIYVNNLEQGYDRESSHLFSVAFQLKMKKLIRKANHPFLYQSLRRVASFFLILLASATLWFTVDADARTAVTGWLKEFYETFFVYSFSDYVDSSNITDYYEPTWIPDGYLKENEYDSGSMITITYQNDSGQILRLHYVYNPNEVSLFVGAANSNAEKIFIDQYEADLFLFDGTSANNILWSDEHNCAFYLSAFLSKTDLIHIANSIYEK